MANVAWLRSLASQELKETLFCATGERPIRTKTPKDLTLEAAHYKVIIVNSRNITVNGDKCRSVSEAKWVIQDLIGDIV